MAQILWGFEYTLSTYLSRSGVLFMTVRRVAVYVHGFNLYHALCALQVDHLKWLNLWKLSKLLIRPKTQKLVKVCYVLPPPIRP